MSARRAHIRRIELHQVRTYERLRLELAPGVTVLVGPNGVGKTNLLEACAVGLTGSSPRTSTEARLVRDGATQARIGLQVQVDDDVHDRDVTLEPGRGKRLRVDGSPAASAAEYARQVPVAAFLPERLLIIRGAPARRRALVDHLATQVLPAAAATQRAYAAALQQRNALLRRAKIGHDVEAQLRPWTEQLVEHGSALRDQRDRLLTQLAPAYAERFEQLTALAGAAFRLELRGSGDLSTDVAELAGAERRRGSTLLGPHLDDAVPHHDARSLRAFGSAGEQRAALLAFTFAAHDLVAERAGTEPVVLLDEPWSELDRDRRRRLTALLQPLEQVVVTSTEPPDHLRAAAPTACVLEVSCGQVRPWHPPPDTDD